jgi:peptidoglycan/xylan/chitin deacetylase (PgdA/CDA1 family)
MMRPDPEGRPMIRTLCSCLPFVLSLAVSAPAANAEPRPVLVTVDDLPVALGRLHTDPAERERITRDMLAVLARHEIRAVGLVTWRNVTSEADRRLLEMWLEAGHELGNHSSSHLSYTRTEPDAYIPDVESARSAIADLVAPHGREVRFFRFPMLREGDTPAKLEAMRAYLGESGQRNLPVTIDNQDWSFEEPWVKAVREGDAAAMARVAEEYHESLRLAVRHHERTDDGLFRRPLPQILLLHAGAVGAAQWDELFGWLERTGHRFAHADEVLADPVFSESHEYVGTHGPGLWDRIASERRRARAEDEIRTLLDAQIAAWNAGDVERFCSFYTEDTAFLSPTGLTIGRQAVVDRYRARYPDRAAMGHLTLEVLEMRPSAGTEVSMMGDARPSRIHGMSVAGRWKLSYPDREPAEGLTLLVLRPTPEGWRIVQDASM